VELSRAGRFFTAQTFAHAGCLAATTSSYLIISAAFSSALLLLVPPRAEAAEFATAFLPGTQIPSEAGIIDPADPVETIEPDQSSDSSAPSEAPGVVLPYRIGDPIGIRRATAAGPGAIFLSVPASPTDNAVAEAWVDDATSPEIEDLFWQPQTHDVARYEALVEELEYTNGAWGQPLGEELMGLGRLLQQQGEYTRALDVFTRAAHINRVNYGLNSLEQLAPVESLVETYVALNQWEEADRHQRYAYYVQSRAFSRDDPRLIPALDNLARWNMQTFTRAINGEPLIKLLEAYRLYHAAVSLVTLNFGPGDPRYVSYLRNMTETAYRLAIYGTQSDLERAAVRHNGSEMAIPSVLDTPLSRLSGFSEGEQALRNIYELYSSPRMRGMEDIDLRRAQALTDLGDWYLTFNRRQSAFRTYSDVHVMLTGAGRDPDIIFGDLVALPGFLNRVDEAYDGDNSLRRGYIDLSVDVSQYGRVTNVTLLAVEPPVAGSITSSIMRQARSLTLRPRFGPDGPQAIREATLRYPFWY
jgi:tetratricopeptide (TPR) repeat protein